MREATYTVGHPQASSPERKNNFRRPERRIACSRQRGGQSDIQHTSQDQVSVRAGKKFAYLFQEPSLLYYVAHGFHLDAFRLVDILERVKFLRLFVLHYPDLNGEHIRAQQ